MQPEPSAITPSATTESPTAQNDDSRKHGLPAHEPPDSLSPADDAGAGTTIPSEDQLALDAALAASLQESTEKPRSGRRLSPPSTPSPPALNRITEYEKASTPPVRKREGPAFEVIKKQRSPSDKRSPIQELPNGWL